VWIDLAGTMLLGLPFCVLALWASWPSVRNSWVTLETSPDPGGLLRYPIKSAILVCFALLLLQCVSGAFKRVAWLRGIELWAGALPELEQNPAEREVLT
jgi:TRAP-type mannitol/chloroaromatic compound transport system permease small subunit